MINSQICLNFLTQKRGAFGLLPFFLWVCECWCLDKGVGRSARVFGYPRVWELSAQPGGWEPWCMSGKLSYRCLDASCLFAAGHPTMAASHGQGSLNSRILYHIIPYHMMTIDTIRARWISDRCSVTSFTLTLPRPSP